MSNGLNIGSQQNVEANVETVGLLKDCLYTNIVQGAQENHDFLQLASLLF